MVYPRPYTLHPIPSAAPNIQVLSRQSVCTIMLLKKLTLTDPFSVFGHHSVCEVRCGHDFTTF